VSVTSLDSDPDLQAQALALWQENRTGPFTALVEDDHLGWVRVPDSIFQDLGVEDPSSGPTAAHIEMLIGVSGALHFEIPSYNIRRRHQAARHGIPVSVSVVLHHVRAQLPSFLSGSHQ
jgi:hypothetical protein